MKILLTANIFHHPPNGGVTKVNRKLLEGLAARGHTIKTVVPALGVPSSITHEEFVSDLEARGVEVKTADNVTRFRLNDVDVCAVVDRRHLRKTVTSELEAFRPDWVIVSSEDPSQNLLTAALGVCPDRVVYMANTISMLPFGPDAFFPSEPRTKLLGRTAAILSVTDFVGSYIKKHSGLDATTMYVPLYDPGPFPVVARYDAPFVTMINRSRVKGAAIFIALARSMPEVKFAVVPSWATTATDLEAVQSIPNVTVLRANTDINEVYAQTRVLLYPSLWAEALSLATVEAMLQGIPVLASNLGGIPEAKMGTDYLLPIRPAEGYEENLDANLVPVPKIPEQDIGPWRAALSSLLADPALFERQCAAAREGAARYAARATVEAYETFLVGLGSPQKSASV